MGDKSAIEWTDATWNPIAGCSLVSPGCTNCYAMKMAARIERMGGVPHYAGLTQPSKAGPVWTGKVARAPDHILTQPLRWKKPRRIFVNSMADLFHDDVPDAWIDKVFAVMALARQHIFQVLTKRAKRMRAYVNRLHDEPVKDTLRRLVAAWPGNHRVPEDGINIPLPNVWLGVSVEDQARADEQIPDLLETPAAIRFLSCEPLLGPVDLTRIPSPVVTPEDEGYYHSALERGDMHRRDGEPDILTGRKITDTVDGPMMERIDWVIAGGESGHGARPAHPDWFRSLRDQCAAAAVPFFFKQWGEWAPSETPPSERQESDELLDIGAWVDNQYMRRVGKKAAGAHLDSREHREFPA